MDCEKGMENHSGIDGDFASHKSTAICWRYQKAKGITKKRAAPVKRCCPFYFFESFSDNQFIPFTNKTPKINPNNNPKETKNISINSTPI